MVTALICIVAVIVLMFGCVVLFGAPYLPTLRPQIDAALDALDLNEGQHILELGSGDGRVLLAAAQRGLYGIGYELNPILVLVSRWRLRRYRNQIRVVWGNAFSKKWPATDAIYVFGIKKLMPKLHKKIVQHAQQTHRPIRLASFGFAVPAKKPVSQTQGIFIYHYSAK